MSRCARPDEADFLPGGRGSPHGLDRIQDTAQPQRAAGQGVEPRRVTAQRAESGDPCGLGLGGVCLGPELVGVGVDASGSLHAPMAEHGACTPGRSSGSAGTGPSAFTTPARSRPHAHPIRAGPCDERSLSSPNPCIDHRGQIPRAGQRRGIDRHGDDLSAMEPGRHDRPHGPPQPCRRPAVQPRPRQAGGSSAWIAARHAPCFARRFSPCHTASSPPSWSASQSSPASGSGAACCTSSRVSASASTDTRSRGSGL